MTSSSQPVPARPAEIAASGRRYAAYVLGVLVLVNFFHSADRVVLSVLMQPIKMEFGFSDTQLGLLGGLAFALFYATLGIPLARLADRKSRITILSCAMVVWSLMTAACGAAMNFTHLLLARIGVGAGEAGALPASHSLLGDYFPKERRAFALGVFSAGSYLGIMFGMVVAGNIAQLYGWRWVFLCLGAPGVLAALLAFCTVREPPRGGLDPASWAPARPATWRQAFGVLFKRGTYVQLVLAFSVGQFASHGIITWVPTFFIRSHGLSLAEIGGAYGLAIGFGGLLGGVAGGVVAPKMIRRDPRWEMWIPAIAYAAAVPLFLLAFLAPPWIAIGLLSLVTFVLALSVGPAFASIQSVSEPHLRATAVAIILFFSSLLGQGGGPVLVGALSDALAPRLGDASLRAALMISTVLIVWAAAHFVLGARTLQRDRVA